MKGVTYEFRKEISTIIVRNEERLIVLSLILSLPPSILFIVEAILSYFMLNIYVLKGRKI